MQLERFLNSSHYEWYPQNVIRTRDEAHKEQASVCGRFRSVIDTESVLASFIAEHIRPIDPLGSGQLFEGSGMPLNWGSLLLYLHRSGVLDQPYFQHRALRNDRPRFPNFALGLNKTSRYTDGYLRDYAGFGSSFSKEEAMSKAIGEALERYFLTLYRREDMTHGSYNSLKQQGYNVLDLASLNTFLPWQKELFPEFAWDMDSSFYWVTGRSHPSGNKVLLPAQLVFWNYKHSNEKVIAHATTSGSAGHFTREEAILSGLLEQIQRDAFLMYWLNGLSPRVLDTSLLDDPQVTGLIEYLGRYRLNVTFLNTSSDIDVPSVTCVIEDAATENGPVISIGAGTGFDMKHNLIQSALEAVSVNNYADSLPLYSIPAGYQPFAHKGIGRRERLSAWKGTEMAERFDFFKRGEKQDARELDTATKNKGTHERLAHIVGEFQRLGSGYEIYTYEVRDKVLDQLGFHVIRTIVPQLIPLYLFEHAAPLNSERLKTSAKRLGYDASNVLNPWPHPFP